MKTERLYYNDSYLRSFEAQIVERGDWKGQPAVALDRSAFYPESGGQPGDQGKLAEVAVLDVQVRDGVVWHILAEPLPEELQSLRGEIDWARRFDHMQQHHGQHLLSAAFIEVADLKTVSFHLGVQSCTIDLDSANLHERDVQAAVALANQIVWEDRPIEARFVSDEELARLPLRKAPSVEGPIRVVSVPDFDYSACGGTHPRSTGSVGMIVVTNWSRQKGGTRVEFLCGQRALKSYQDLNGMARRAAGQLSVGIEQFEEAFERLRSNEAAARRALEAAQTQLLGYEAQALLAQAETIGRARLLVRRFDARSPAELRSLAERIIAVGSDAVVVLASADNKAQIVLGRGADLSLDAGKLLREGLSFVGGRGGGQAQLAQGGGPDVAGLDAALEALSNAIKRDL
jgi:Alanyl-tRNA synthetase